MNKTSNKKFKSQHSCSDTLKAARRLTGRQSSMLPMKTIVLTLIFGLLAATRFSLAQNLIPSLADGEYAFEHKFSEAEQHKIKSIQLVVIIKESHIVVINRDRDDVFPMGVLEEGELMWHSKSGHWIIASSPSDIEAEDVGGCSDGPTVIDLEQRIYWTC